MEEVSTDKQKPSHTTASDGHTTLNRPSIKKEEREKERETSLIGEMDRKPRNPFLLPPDVEIFKKREADAIISQQEKTFLRSLPTHMKTTYLSRLRCHSIPVRSSLGDSVLETEKCRRNRTTRAVLGDKGYHQKEESIRDDLVKQREAFRLQYSLSVKRETIQGLQNEMAMERHRIHLFEKQLQEDAVAFDRFIKENDQNSVEAVKLAERETLVKMEKITEIKKVTAQMMAIKSEISKYQETLNDYKKCKTFLMAVAPPQWLEEQNQKRQRKREAKMKEKIKEMELDPAFLPSNIKGTGKCDSKTGKATQARRFSICRKQSVTQVRRSSALSVAKEETDFDSSDSDEEPALCFSDPKEMLSVLTGLEEQNLFYIQNFQETEEAMDEIRRAIQQTRDKMNHEIHLLQQQMEIMQATIKREQEKVSELELKSKIFSYGEYRADKQDHMLKLLHNKVKEVYKACLGELDYNISTVHMLACIENKVMDVLDCLEMMPPEKVDFLRSLRDMEKRIKMREEKAQLRKQHQEARLKLAMERATSDSKKRMGRKLMPRSEPLESKKKNKDHVKTTKEQQDYLYFFT